MKYALRCSCPRHVLSIQSIWVYVLLYLGFPSPHDQLLSAVFLGLQHQMAPTFVGDSMHQPGEDKVSEAMTGGSLLGEAGMTEIPGLQAALAAASAAMQAEGQSMPTPPIRQQTRYAEMKCFCPCWPRST